MSHRRGLLAISPFLFFLLFYFVLSLVAGDFYKVPILVAFLLASVYAIVITRAGSVKDRVAIFAQGVGTDKVLLIIWIFVLAGAFASTAKGMGCVDATVNVLLSVTPPRLILVGLFVASCLISMATGSAIGTVIPLVPIAVGMGTATDANLPLLVSAVVGGSFFGDNLSFISDTTIVATSTQRCSMADKFRVNLWIVLPAALAVVGLYAWLGSGITASLAPADIQYVKVIPYAAVLVGAICGVDVLLVLFIGILLAGGIGLATGDYDFYACLAAVNDGVVGMGEWCIIVLLAGGLMELVKHNGGLDYLMQFMKSHVHSRRGAQFGMSALVMMVGICTGINTVAILSVGDMAREVSLHYRIDNRKMASLLDTTACFTQGLLPYGAHLLMAASLSGIASVDLLPYLYYPYALAVMVVLSILLGYPKAYSEPAQTV